MCEQSLTGHTAKVTAMDLGMEGCLLVTSSADKTARVWDVSQGHCLATLEGHTAEVLDVAVDHKGRFCATASGDGDCRLWSLANGKCAYILRSSLVSGTQQAVSACAFASMRLNLEKVYQGSGLRSLSCLS